MSNSTNDDSSGKCPVDHKSPSSLWKVFGSQDSKNASKEQQSETSIPPASVASLEEAAKYAQTPHPRQRLPLSTHRAESSIPRGGGVNTNNDGDDEDASPSPPPPHHQFGTSYTNNKWVYPSEQQVFNAMKRKGYNTIEEEAIPSFLQVHNSVNERGWNELRAWEKATQNDNDIQLVRFQGRPQDLSPKAWFWTNVLQQEKPFDRHDWYIDNGVDHEKRYVLDFYMTGDDNGNDNQNKSSTMPRVEIDVRPALDTPQAFVQRGVRVLQDMFPGITKELERMQARR